jgi:2,5-furandicarboxylate decarboxylase 1
MDLRTFLTDLEKAGELLRIQKPVNPRHISPLTSKSKKAVFFEKIDGYDMPVVAGLVSTVERLSIGVRVPKETMGLRFSEAFQRAIPPVLVKHAPCQEVVLTGKDVDLTRLPLPLQSKLDGGPYQDARESRSHPARAEGRSEASSARRSNPDA